MSTIFRLKYRLGLIPSAKKIDADWKELMQVRDELNSIENSKELRLYNELNVLTASYDFQVRKKEIQNLTFNLSSEKGLLQELNKLEKDRTVRDYFKVLKSPQLERSNKVKISPDLKKYQQLKEEIGSPEFGKRKKGNPSYDEYLRLSKNHDILFYQKYINSSSYDNYSSVKDSYELERLAELRKITTDPEFKENVVYLKNKKRYETTELYQQEKELKTLVESSLIKRYHLLKKLSKLNFFKEWSLVFEENFNKNHLDKSRWQTEKLLGIQVERKEFLPSR